MSRGLRSAGWFARHDRQGYEHRSMMRSLGLPNEAFDGRPVIGICSVWSEFNPCDAGLRDLAMHVKAGVLEAGGLPLECPAMAVGEPLMRPSPMMFRNLASMALEELIRANPIDGVVLLAGCDKTGPALLMGAASCDIPAVLVSSGPKTSGHFRGERIGSGTHIWQIEGALARGEIDARESAESEIAMSPTIGTCNTMGSASTIAALAEAMGIALPGNSCVPATDVRRQLIARKSGTVAVDAVRADRRISSVLDRRAFANAVRVVGAIGGSTNAVLHLIALAGRLGVPFGLDDWDELGRGVPCLVDLLPSGRYLMDDFFAAGGLGVVLRRLSEQGLFDANGITVGGMPMRDQLVRTPCYNDEVIRSVDRPVKNEGGLVVLRGSLCPDGAILKPSAATPALLQHRGRALVFDSLEDYYAVVDDPSLDVEPDDILVMRNCGPRGYPGMPEVGNFRIPTKLAKAGVTDMIRISDARMSGTAFGTIILHVAPEAAVGGPISLVRTGDFILVDVQARRLDLCVDPDELHDRRSRVAVQQAAPDRGYAKLYVEHVMQANLGADLDFLIGCSGADIPRDSS